MQVVDHSSAPDRLHPCIPFAALRSSCMAPIPRRIRREQKTVEAMIALYCRGQKHAHGDRPSSGSGGLCDSCHQLADYARTRLNKCPYAEDKPTCAVCPIHCYQRLQKERIREIMRYSGPRMIFRHPVLALFHLIDGRRKPAPEIPAPGRADRR